MDCGLIKSSCVSVVCGSVHSVNSDEHITVNINREKLRLEVMRLVEVNPELSQREMARELGVSLGGVNYAMKALVERGLVKVKLRSVNNKLGYVYVLTPAGLKQGELASSFLSRKLQEYEILKRELSC